MHRLDAARRSRGRAEALASLSPCPVGSRLRPESPPMLQKRPQRSLSDRSPFLNGAWSRVPDGDRVIRRPMTRVRFRLLGPLEAAAGARTLSLGGSKQRALL